MSMSEMAWKGTGYSKKVQHMQMAHRGMWLHPGDWKKERNTSLSLKLVRPSPRLARVYLAPSANETLPILISVDLSVAKMTTSIFSFLKLLHISPVHSLDPHFQTICPSGVVNHLAQF